MTKEEMGSLGKILNVLVAAAIGSVFLGAVLAVALILLSSVIHGRPPENMQLIFLGSSFLGGCYGFAKMLLEVWFD
ncbi:hypothetical protein [Synechococcus elongatus]|uniref:hypothetical protein n=1 Tax=Synechococcus elongatus TaxID=32046 RepID=UPI000F7F526E|nr:hypothetical protein [Synechococcus elongatus]